MPETDYKRNICYIECKQERDMELIEIVERAMEIELGICMVPEDEGDQRESRSGCESENEEESRLGGAETVFG